MFQRQIKEVQYTIPLRHITNIEDNRPPIDSQEAIDIDSHALATEPLYCGS